jgi:hypothetical protein
MKRSLNAALLAALAVFIPSTGRSQGVVPFPASFAIGFPTTTFTSTPQSGSFIQVLPSVGPTQGFYEGNASADGSHFVSVGLGISLGNLDFAPGGNAGATAEVHYFVFVSGPVGVTVPVFFTSGGGGSIVNSGGANGAVGDMSGSVFFQVIGRLLVNAAWNPPRRHIWTALRLERAATTIARACEIEKRLSIVDQIARRCEDVLRRADVHIAILVEREVFSTESSILTLRFVDHRDVRSDVLVCDKPIEVRS